jgi:hypothetical protein
MGEQEYARRIVAHVREHADEATADEYVAAMPPETLWAGLDRYWSRQKG